jgi:hypothetical protein
VSRYLLASRKRCARQRVEVLCCWVVDKVTNLESAVSHHQTREVEAPNNDDPENSDFLVKTVRVVAF